MDFKMILMDSESNEKLKLSGFSKSDEGYFPVQVEDLEHIFSVLGEDKTFFRLSSRG
jgi:hypothetical protein